MNLVFLGLRPTKITFGESSSDFAVNQPYLTLGSFSSDSPLHISNYTFYFSGNEDGEKLMLYVKRATNSRYSAFETKYLPENQTLISNTDYGVFEFQFENLKEQLASVIPFYTNGNLFDLFYRRSPEENMNEVKKFISGHTLAIKFALGTVALYTAYKILDQNSIDDILKSLPKGVEFDNLKDKKTIKKLATTGAGIATVYGATSLFKSSVKDIDKDSLPAVFRALEDYADNHKSFAKKCEKYLPVALSLVVAYVITRKKEDIDALFKQISDVSQKGATKVYGVLEIAKDFVLSFVEDHTGVDLEENYMPLLISCLSGIIVFILSNCFNNKEQNKEYEGIKAVAVQTMNFVKKTAPALFASVAGYLISSGYFTEKDIDAIDFEYEDVPVLDPEVKEAKPDSTNEALAS